MLRLFIRLYVFIAIALIGLSALLDNLVFDQGDGTNELQVLGSALAKITAPNKLAEFAQDNGLVLATLPNGSISFNDNLGQDPQDFIIGYSEDGHTHIYIKNQLGDLWQITLPTDRQGIPFFWYSLTFFTLLALLIAAWTWPLWRDIRRLEQSASSLQPDGSLKPVDISNRSSVGRIASALQQLSNQVQNLLRNQQELTSAVAHEFRTPLARLKFALESVPDEPLRESMREDLTELDNLIQEMLEFSQSEHHTPELAIAEIDTQQLVRQLVEAMPESQSGKIDFHMQFEDVHLSADGHFVERAIQNLLNNAAKYCQSTIKISCRKQNNGIQIWVEDDGEGVPIAMRDKVFQPFYRPDPSRNRHHGGAGLGLATVTRIQNWHDGDCWVEDSELGGAKFVLSYPIHTAN